MKTLRPSSWAFALVFLLPAVGLCGLHPPRADARPPLHELSTRSTTCLDGFDANSDFYGFGIRLGVYLQWVASWIANTFSPEDAAANHDANSIFVLATATALAVAFRTSELRPAEAYIMFSICFGFYFTVLSIFGFRIHFLRPESVREFAHEFLHTDMGRHAVKQNVKRGARSITTALSMFRGIVTPFKISFTSAAFGKHYSLSWTGIAWRSGIASLVCCLNIYFWFNGFDARDDQSSLDDCGYAVFLFASFRLDSAAQTAFKVLAIILSIVPFYIIYVAYILTTLVIGSLFRDNGVTIDDHAASAPISDGPGIPISAKTRRNRWMNALISLLVRDEKVHENREKLVSSDADPTDEDQDEGQDQDQDQDPPVESAPAESKVHRRFAATEKRASVIYCALAHIFLATTIICLIVFIEKTIAVNRIQGAYVIRSTGQLIPFVIGVASMLATVKDISLDWLRDKYPNRENVHFRYAGRIAMDFLSAGDHLHMAGPVHHPESGADAATTATATATSSGFQNQTNSGVVGAA